MLFISAAFMILGGIVMALLGSSLSSGSGRPDPFGEVGARVVGVVYFVMGFLYFYPGIKLFKYASRISDLVSSGRSEDLESALSEQMGFWRFSGIITLLFVGLFVLMFGLAMLGAVVGAASR